MEATTVSAFGGSLEEREEPGGSDPANGTVDEEVGT